MFFCFVLDRIAFQHTDTHTDLDQPENCSILPTHPALSHAAADTLLVEEEETAVEK